MKVSVELEIEDAERIATYLQSLSRRFEHDARRTPLSIIRMVEPTLAREAQRLSDLVREQIR